MHYLISYDIGDNNLRTKLYKLLLAQNCKAVQRSVFVLLNANGNIKKRVQKAVLELTKQQKNNPQDSIIWLALHNKSLDEAVLWGDESLLELAKKEKLFELL